MDTEIRVLKNSECPYIIKLHDVLKTQNNIYLIMEYCAGGDLENYVKVHGRVEEHIAKRWLSQLVESFIYLQDHHIMHRDIKPENIAIDENNNALLCDFGLCAEVSLGNRLTFCGTYEYMAPEIMKELPYNQSIDIWSLGILLYECVQGESPFKVFI